MSTETVKVKTDHTEEGFMIINKSDLTEGHDLYVETAAKKPAAEKPSVGQKTSAAKSKQ